MKKIIAIAVLGTITLASCTKDYTCTLEVAGFNVSQDYLDLDKDEAADQEAECVAATGTWAVK